MRWFGATLAHAVAVFLLLAGMALTGSGSAASMVQSAEPIAAKTFAETWQIEVEIARFDAPSINPDPSVNIPEARFVFLTVIGTATNISNEPVVADPVAALQLRDGQGRTYAPAGYNETTPAYLPTFNPDVPGDFAAGFPVPLKAEQFRLISTDDSFDLPLPTPIDPAPTIAAEEPSGADTSALGLGPSVMGGGVGDVWELDLEDDSFWWAAVDFGWIDSPSPRYLAEPQGSWFVVLIDIGTYDGWISNDFPYGFFALEDNLGNGYFPDLTATSAYCDAYCDMDIEQQDFSGWVGHTFHQAIVFDVSAISTGLSTDDSGFTLRTLDGLIGVPLGTTEESGSRILTIYKAACPSSYTGDASADECDANPVPGVPFRIGRPFTDAFSDNVPTDAEGLVSFEFNGLPLDGTLRVIEELPADTERFVVYCVDGSGDPLSITYLDNSVSNPGLGVVDVEVGEQGDVACDWYNVPAQ